MKKFLIFVILALLIANALVVNIENLDDRIWIGKTRTTITDVQASPNSQEKGGYVNITVNVTDGIGVDTVWVDINGVGNYSMNYASGDEYYYNRTYSLTGIYYFNISANDTLNNWNTQNGQFEIDCTKPELTNVQASPNTQEVNEYVNITATITDNYALGTLLVNIFGIGTYDMSYAGGNIYYYNSSYSTKKIYDFTIVAYDTSNNWNSSSGQFEIDCTVPVITNVQATPNPQEVNRYVNITATITDNYALDVVWVDIVGVGTYDMTYAGSDIYYYNTSYSLKCIYDFTIWANDTSDNLDSSGSQFEIDCTNPVISNVQTNSNTQEVFGYINITCNITDNYALNVVNITLNGTNYTMLNARVDGYYYNTSYNVTGTYNYTIWANDTSDNLESVNGTFNIVDTTKPEITNITAEDTEVYGYINITCNITDNYALNIINITLNGTNYSMMYGGGDIYYYNTSYNVTGTYNYTIWANDTSDNLESVNGTFNIVDTMKPDIENITAEDTEVYGYINITCNITDNYALNVVNVNIAGINHTMIHAENNSYYYNATYSIIGKYDYIIWANDTSDNLKVGGGTFDVVDTTKPDFVNIIAEDTEVYSYVNITVTVTDNYEVNFVNVNIEGINHSMENIGIYTYCYNSTYSIIGEYQYSIWIVDTSNNINSSNGSFYVLDVTKPEVISVQVTPNIQQANGSINITAIVTDDYGLKDVRLYIAGIFNVSMNYLGNDIYYYTTTYSSVGINTFNVLAVDFGNNWDSYSGEFEIKPGEDDGNNDDDKNKTVQEETTDPMFTIIFISMDIIIGIILGIIVMLILRRKKSEPEESAEETEMDDSTEEELPEGMELQTEEETEKFEESPVVATELPLEEEEVIEESEKEDIKKDKKLEKEKLKEEKKQEKQMNKEEKEKLKEEKKLEKERKKEEKKLDKEKKQEEKQKIKEEKRLEKDGKREDKERLKEEKRLEKERKKEEKQRIKEEKKSEREIENRVEEQEENYEEEDLEEDWDDE